MENIKVDQQTVNDFLFASNIVLTPQQKTLFTQMAIKNNLDPFKREIYAISYGNNMTVVTSYTVYLTRAYASGLMNGWDAQIEKQDGKVIGGTITIHRKDMQYPIVHSVAFSEIAQANQNWTKKPEFMTRKTLISQGMRLAFPEFMAGMPYTEDEMDGVYANVETSFPSIEIKGSEKSENHSQKESENQNTNLENESSVQKTIDMKKSFEADIEKSVSQKVSLNKKTLADIPKSNIEETNLTGPISTQQIADLKNAWTGLGFDAKSVPDAKLWSKLLEKDFGAKSSKDLTTDQANELLDYLLSTNADEIKKIK